MSRFGLRLWLLAPNLLLTLSLTGCITLGGDSGDSARQPMSLEVAVGEARQRAKIHTELGALYLQDNRFAIALDEARIALAADSGYAPAYNLLGLTHMLMGENKLAEENFERALSAAPGDPEITNNYGWFLCQTGREQRSLDYFTRAARNPLYQTPAKPYTSAGICLIRLKDDKGAEQNLRRALQLDPRNTQAMFWLAELSYRNNRPLETRQWLLDLEKLVELNAEVIWLALRTERKLGNREAEARHAGQLRRKFATSPEHRKLLQGEYE
jgi:type IV pilus assembly protein PilF